MDIKKFYADKDEKPLDNILQDGGMCAIFRSIACIGDSLSSGEHERVDGEGNKEYHDYYEYSWGQYMARMMGSKVYNFSRGGMTAKWYCETYANLKGFWDPDLACQCYIIAMGCNDTTADGTNLGEISDIDTDNYENNKKTFVGYYGKIIQKYKEIQPDAKFFLMTMPRYDDDPKEEARDLHQKLLYEMAELFDNTYVIDFRKYAPKYDEEFKKYFYLEGHMNAAGYLLTAKMVASYIDYIIRNNPDDFREVGFIGKNLK